MSVRLVRRALHRGTYTDLAIRIHHEHLCHEKERPPTPSGPATFDLAGRRASLGLAAHLGHGARMPRLRFYNRRSRHEHSMSTPPLETLAERRGQARRRPVARSSIGGRCRHLTLCSTPDHLAVIRPPAAACLTARPPASVRSTRRTELAWASCRTLNAPRDREHRRLFSSPDTLSIEILWRLFAGRRYPVPRTIPFPAT
jgi:hypothetical protein